MAEKEGDLIFPMKLEVDPTNFKSGWEKIEPKLQAIIDAKPLKVNLAFDEAQIKRSLAALKKYGLNEATPGWSKEQTSAFNAITRRIHAETAQRKSIDATAGKEFDLTTKRNKAAISANNLTLSEMKLKNARDRGIAAVHTQNKAYQAQRGILNGMPQFINSYISVLGAYRLGQNIVQTTAEFEMQRVALAAIIRDKSKADELFSKDVELGLKSPFQIKELITATKQLSAYRIETDKLFDTTKRLADISAGLGVGMDRLILAYGQVRAASVLRGQELRQFTESGVPLVELLADKFTKLRGELVSTGDVFKLISERGVSFGMVREVFEDLTNAGGMFYNMQEIQAETLRGSLSNLRDAYDKMFMQIGDSQMGPMKAGIDAARSLMENWREVNVVLSPLVLSLVAYNVALKMTSTLTGKVTVLSNIYGKTIAGITIQERMLTKATVLKAASQRSAAAATLLAGRANNVLTRSFYLLRAAMLANPVTFWVTVITTAAAAVWGLVEAMKFSRSESELLNDNLSKSTNEIKASADLSVMSLSMLMGKLKNATAGSEEYSEIIKRINGLAGPHLKANLDTAASYKEVEKAVRGATEAMRDAAKAKAYEAGMQIIDTEYSSRITKAYGKAQKGLVARGFNKAQASAISQYISGEITANPEKYKKDSEIVKLANEVITRSAKEAGLANMELGLRAVQAGFDIREAFVSIARTQTESADSADSFLGVLKSSFGTIDGYALEVKKIEDRYKAAMAEVRKSATHFNNLGQPISAATKEFELQRDRLTELIGVYKKFNQYSPWQKATADLEKLNSKGKDWETTVDRMTTGTGVMVTGTLGSGAQKFSRAQSETGNESYLDYVSRLQSEYAKLLETQKLLNANPKAKIPGVDKAQIAGDIKILQSLASALGWTLSDPNAKKDATTKTEDPRIKTLSNQLKTLREAYSKYLDIRKDIGDAAARSEITALYGGLTGGMALAFSGPELEAASKKIEAAFETLGVDATDELRDAILKRTDTSFDEIAANFKRNLDEMGRKIEQTQRANEFFEKMLGLTGSEEAARRITQAMGMAVGDVYSGIMSNLSELLGYNYMQGVDIGDVNQVQDAINKMRQDGFETTAKAAQDQLDQLVKYNESILEELYSGTDKYQDYKDRLLQIEVDYQKRLKVISDNLKAGTITPDVAQSERGKAGKTRTGAIAALDLETLQGTDDYTRAFENLDTVATSTLQRLYDALLKIRDSGALDPDKLKTVTDQMEKLRTMMTGRSGFDGLKSSINAVTTAYKKLSEARKEYGQASKEAEAAENAYRVSLVELKDGLSVASSELSSMSGLVSETTGMVDGLSSALGSPFSDETNEYIKAFTDGIGMATTAVSIMTSAVDLLNSTMLPLLAAGAILGALFVAVKAINNAIEAKKERELKKYSDSMEALADNVERLNNAVKDNIGSSYVKNIRDQIAATEEMIRLTEQKIRAEEEIVKKGENAWFNAAKKKQDAKEASERLKELSKDVEKYKNEIVDLERTLNQELTGFSGPIEAGKAFADSWYDAYVSTGDTMGAITDNFDEMVSNMVTKMNIAEIFRANFDDAYKYLQEQLASEDGLTDAERATFFDMMRQSGVDANEQAKAYMEYEKSQGRTVTPTASKKELSGISAAAAAGLSEDSANTLGGYLNSNLMQLVLQTGLQNRIALAVEAGNVQKPLADIYAIQTQSLAAINSIKADTAIMVSKLTRMVENQDSSMIQGGQKAINVRLLN